ncbi:MAG: putative DNA binding domain-containing protein [Muribaculaceae bacterium]|nr:putative DNA binding domain-containing protein [Muribaculaceae bacterium]
MIELKNTTDFIDYLDKVLSHTESSDLEYKSAAGGFPGSFWDTYSAFANTDGGTIILGVSEKNNRFFLDGLTDEKVEKYRKDFWNNINNKSTISCNLMNAEDLVVEKYKGHQIMIFFIPRASREQRPIYRTTNPYNGTFKRDYEGDYKCTETEVQRMFADADASCPADSRILKSYTLADIDKNSLDQYRQLFAIAKPNHPWLAESDLELLKKLGGYRRDRATGEEGFTLAGMLMFGKSSSITDKECCPNFFPDYQEKLTNESDERWTNRVYPDGTWEANLFQYYKNVLPRLQAILPKPFRLENNIRKEETAAHVAVREALINLCIHADYSENASIIARLFKNKIVLSNPGTMLVSRAQYYEGGESVCRNKALQTMFMMLGAAEKAGSGVDKILKGWKEANWIAPIIRTKVRPDKVELTLMMESIIDERIKEQLVNLFGDNILTVSHEHLLVLSFAATNGFVTNEGLRFVLNMHKVDIGVLLREMCLSGLLVAQGHGRGTKYKLPYVASSDGNVASYVASSDSNVASAHQKRYLKKRMSFNELQQAVSDKASEWISLEDLALSLGRNKTYLRNHVMPKLLELDVIEMMFANVPQHPGQKYRTKHKQ